MTIVWREPSYFDNSTMHTWCPVKGEDWNEFLIIPIFFKHPRVGWTGGVRDVLGNAQMHMHTHSARNARLNTRIGEKCTNFKKCHKMIFNSWLAHIHEKLRRRIFSRLTSSGLFFQIWPHPMTAFDLVGKNDNWKVYSLSTGLQQASVILGSRGDPNFGLWPWPWMTLQVKVTEKNCLPLCVQ